MVIHRTYRIFQVWQIPVFLHWSAIALLGFLLLLTINGGIALLFAAISLFALMLIHELGHASLARRLGYHVHLIELFPIHGRCWYDAPRSRYHVCLIAWGGVSAQASVLVFAAIVFSLVGTSLPNALNLSLFVFTYFNAAIIFLNLAPIRGLDGSIAWKIFRESRRA